LLRRVEHPRRIPQGARPDERVVIRRPSSGTGSVHLKRAAAPVRRRRLESRMGARPLRRDRRRQDVDAPRGGETHSPLRRGSRQATAARAAEQEREEPSRHSVERFSNRSRNAHLERADLLGHTEPGHCLWPACQLGTIRSDEADAAVGHGLRARCATAPACGLRFHDLRYAVITELAEMSVADHALESISGDLSRRIWSTTRTSASTRSARLSTRWTPPAAPRRRTATTNAAATANIGRGESTPSSRCPPTSRHNHVTVCG
jgi:hypothetical protein